MKNEAMELTVSSVAGKVAVGGGVATFFAGWTVNHVAAVGGLLIALLGVIVQIYYKEREERRRQERFRLEVQRKLLHPYEDDDNE